MKVIYHLKHTSDDKIVISFSVGDKNFVTSSGKKPGTLSQLHSLCKNNIHTVLHAQGLGSGHYIEWDEDVSEIPNLNVIGLGTYKKRVIAPQTDVSDVVYEVIQVDGNWTVIKHDCPLLTWDEAVAELKKRI